MINAPPEHINNSVLADRYMPRPRLDGIFDRMARRRLVYCVGGAGYGKSVSVYHYIAKQRDAAVRWMQLTEHDNIGARFWESLTRRVSADNPDLANKLSGLGFPETHTRFKQFADILKSAEHKTGETYLVLDDFHVIRSEQALAFAERCAHLPIPGAHLIIISRQEPAINAVSLFSRNKAGIVTEDDLRFTADETAEYLTFNAIPFNTGDLPRFVGATNGWALALKLLSMMLKKTPCNPNRALAAMKQNIFKLLETEAFGEFPADFQKQLAKVYLIAGLPSVPFNELFPDAPFDRYAPQLSSFIWFDGLFNDYRINPLYLEFLHHKQDMLTESDKQDVYIKAADWCAENGLTLDALGYYAKSGQYGRILNGLLSMPLKPPYDTCEYLLGVFNEIDIENADETQAVLLLKHLYIPLLYAGTGDYGEAAKRSMDDVRKWERSGGQNAAFMLYIAYSNLAYIDTYICTVTHVYDAPKYLKKAVGYYKMSDRPVTGGEEPTGAADIRGFACLVGEGAALAEFDKFLNTARETAVYVSQTYHSMYYGYDDLVNCEINFFKNKLDAAGKYARDAALKAREKKQYGIGMTALYYLLRMAIHDGDYLLTQEILNQMRGHLDIADFWNRQTLYDLYAGSFYAHIGVYDLTPNWIAVDDKEAGTARIPLRELIVGVRYCLARQKYKQAFAILVNAYPRDPQERFYFGELILLLLLAVTRLKTGDTPGAAADFNKAYDTSFNGVFEMPFIELGRAFKQLAAAARQEGYIIGEEWLKTTERKAAAYAKKTAVIAGAFKKDKKIGDEIQLSERERELLNDLYSGLSREEMAATRYLSVNTVNKTLQSLFIKLEANNTADAVRIGIEKRIVG